MGIQTYNIEEKDDKNLPNLCKNRQIWYEMEEHTHTHTHTHTHKHTHFFIFIIFCVK
jgi:hypothetical protein